MRVEVTGRHIEITPAIRAHVENALGKLSNIFKDSNTVQAHVVVDVEKNRQRAEIILTWRDRTLTANQSDKDLYLALTRVVDKIEKQALRLKEKRVDRRHGAKNAAEVTTEPDLPVPAAPSQPQIISAQSYSVKPMTAEEAALSLSGEANQFLVFRDAETEQLSVLYKRKDGNYGLIQP
jgi:putative sigma-54 modulation protein